MTTGRVTPVGLSVLVLAGLVIFFAKASAPVPVDVTTTCASSQTFHIHPHLQIIIGGQNQVIPGSIGLVSPTCNRPIHTHDETGKIHIEFDRPYDFTLGQFFQVWGKNFNQLEVMGHRVDRTHILTMTVGGQPNSDFDKLVLRDNQQIVVTYGLK